MDDILTALPWQGMSDSCEGDTVPLEHGLTAYGYSTCHTYTRRRYVNRAQMVMLPHAVSETFCLSTWHSLTLAVRVAVGCATRSETSRMSDSDMTYSGRRAKMPVSQSSTIV
jgi:hypothetical protein